MDFSTTRAALRSLRRRNTIPDNLRSIVDQLEGPFAEDGNDGGCAPELVEDPVLLLLDSNEWEGVAVGFLLAQTMVEKAPQRRRPSFLKELLTLCDKHLEHAEPRVRSLVAGTLGALTRAGGKEAMDGNLGEAGEAEAYTGLAVYCLFRERLLGAITTNFERTKETITDVISGVENVAVDDTSGWKALETSLLALKEFVDALGRTFIDGGHLTQGTIKYIVSGATVHVNRHVREASFQIIRSILDACGTLSGPDAPLHAKELAVTFADTCALGMQDNWSQVRYAASTANRSFLKALSPQDREPFYPKLLPRMCLNRYYLADGVKLYSQETWQMFMGSSGREMVGKHAQHVTEYYCMASELDNHCVRESACHSIAEMAEKVAPEYLASHVDRLLRALLVCFFDESWPVRDAACVASGRFAGAYPNECRPCLDRLYERWFCHVGDPIWSVRDDSATALGSVCRAYGDEASEKVSAWIRDNLPKAKQQKSESAADHKLKQNDARAHTDNQLYSCGSLAPKLKKGGCSDCEVTRPSEPWEFSDGAVYLVRELCAVKPESGVGFFEEVAEIARLTHFVQADCLRETIWKQLPTMGKSVGKKIFKRYLDVFLGPLFDTLSRMTTSHLARYAAVSCIRQLSAFIGPAIFRGRLSEAQLKVLESEVGVGQAEAPLGTLMGMTPAPWATMAS